MSHYTLTFFREDTCLGTVVVVASSKSAIELMLSNPCVYKVQILAMLPQEGRDMFRSATGLQIERKDRWALNDSQRSPKNTGTTS